MSSRFSSTRQCLQTLNFSARRMDGGFRKRFVYYVKRGALDKLFRLASVETHNGI